MLMNTRTSYGTIAKFLHWLIAILLIAMLAFGFFLDDIPQDYKGQIYNIHKLTGLSILTLLLLRVLWAIINIKPDLPHGMPFWQRAVAQLTHIGLYVLAITMPLAGWVGSSAVQKYPHIGNFQLKLPIEQSKEIADVSFNVHEVVAVSLIALISLHVLASLYHHYIKRDDVLKRML